MRTTNKDFPPYPAIAALAIFFVLFISGVLPVIPASPENHELRFPKTLPFLWEKISHLFETHLLGANPHVSESLVPNPQENIPVGWVSCTQATPCASSATTFYATTVTTLYRLSASVSCTASTAAATAILIVKYTDPSNTVQTLTLATATCTTLGAASIANTLQPLNILTGTAVQYSVTVVNAPSYQARVSLVREGLN